jgi:arsenate reductase-like glutaredoxin family protein
LSKEEQAQVNAPEKALAYLLQNTSAIKRPIIEKNGEAILIGFSEENYIDSLK